MRLAIGIDLGGTNLRGALCSERGEILSREEVKARAEGPPDALLEDIKGLILKLSAQTDQEIVGIGCGIPGIVDHEKGLVYQSPHFPQWKEVAVKAQLEEALGRSVCIDNDANGAALGEACFGAGKGRDYALCLTLGTGIGGGVYYQGSILRGEHGFAGEVGHIVIESEGLSCPCGGRGCWEMYASASGLKRLIRETWNEAIEPQEIAARAAAGDDQAKAVFQRYGYYLGVGIVSLVNVLGVHTVILGGRVARSWEHFIAATKEEFQTRVYQQTAQLAQFFPAKLGDDAGVIGMASMALRTGSS